MKPRTFSRASRVADVIHRRLAYLIHQEFKDPRMGMATISSVSVSADLKHAKVYITVLEDKKIAETLKLLNEANGFFRSELAHTMQLRSIPTLQFFFDDSVIRGNRIQTILESCIREP